MISSRTANRDGTRRILLGLSLVLLVGLFGGLEIPRIPGLLIRRDTIRGFSPISPGMLFHGPAQHCLVVWGKTY